MPKQSAKSSQRPQSKDKIVRSPSGPPRLGSVTDNQSMSESTHTNRSKNMEMNEVQGRMDTMRYLSTSTLEGSTAELHLLARRGGSVELASVEQASVDPDSAALDINTTVS